jgi:hypothetical protein
MRDRLVDLAADARALASRCRAGRALPSALAWEMLAQLCEWIVGAGLC